MSLSRYKLRITGQGLQQKTCRIYLTVSTGQMPHGILPNGEVDWGLAIVSKIISDHGGKVWAESIEGVGTSFLFYTKKKK